uniref:Uncharacterized protein n=1 Tax=Anopheles atroparvus TaxID=41427 RepID=A0A182JIA0_ANOAO
MWSHAIVSLLLLLLPWISSTRTEQTKREVRHPQCGRRNQDCEWFCGQDLPFVNRSSTGAFETEFMRPISYRAITERTRRQEIPIFHIPGLKSWRCLELSVRCSSSSYGPNTSGEVYDEQYPGPMLQLTFRCQHFVVSYVAFFKGSRYCYEVRLEHLSHRMKGKQTNCIGAFLRPYKLIGDGHRYFMILFCRDYVMEEDGSDLAYWLFVNKRNTPQQNQDIVHQLSSGPEPFLVTQNVPLAVVEGVGTEKDPLIQDTSCQCNVFERYNRAVKRCQKPFVVPDQQSSIRAFHFNHAKDPSEIALLVDVTTAKTNRLADERLRWFVIKCLAISAVLGLVLYAVLLQMEQKTEQSLSHNNFVCWYGVR